MVQGQKVPPGPLNERSIANLATCHPDLQRVVEAAAKKMASVVICGHRGKVDQDKAFVDKRSNLMWPFSRHNSVPSEAVDVCPAPINWEDVAAFEALAVIIRAESIRLGVELTWGGEWKSRDLPHWELKRRRTI